MSGIKEQLINKLKAEKCFWSYNPDSITDVDDDIVIEKTLIYLDIPEIKQLFLLYPKGKIKRVWTQRLLPQGEYLYTLNRFFAWYLFDIKKPDAYLKSMQTRHLHRLCQSPV